MIKVGDTVQYAGGRSRLHRENILPPYTDFIMRKAGRLTSIDGDMFVVEYDAIPPHPLLLRFPCDCFAVDYDGRIDQSNKKQLHDVVDLLKTEYVTIYI